MAVPEEVLTVSFEPEPKRKKGARKNRGYNIEIRGYAPERETPLTSQWRVWPAVSSVPTMSASTMTRVKLLPSETEELAGAIETLGAGLTSVFGSVVNIQYAVREFEVTYDPA